MGNAESSQGAQSVSPSFEVEMNAGCLRELVTTRFVTTKAVFAWSVRDLWNWPKGDYDASSPPFIHPSATRWSMQLSKDFDNFHLAFQLLSSPSDVPVRASIKTKATFSAGQISELPAIESEQFKVGDVKGKALIRGFSQSKEVLANELLLESEVTVVCGIVGSAPGATNTLKEDLSVLLEMADDADVTLLVGPRQERLKAHSTILRARSAVMDTILRSPESASSSGYVLNMQKVELRVATEFLRYIYTDQMPLLSEMPEELLAIANRYELNGLQRRCELELCERLTVENAARTAVLGVVHSCLTLLQVVLPFIQQRRAVVMGTPGWARAVRTTPEAMNTVQRLLADADKGEFKIRL